MLLPQLETQLDATATSDQYSNQVRWVIERLISSGSPPIDQIAKELGISVRTLQRKMNSEGHTYKELLNQVRLDLAKSYLCETEMSLNEVAALLGYEDNNSFYRAFKALEGRPPSIWRDTHKSQMRSYH